MLGHGARGNSIFALANLGRSVLSHSLVEKTGKLHVASHFPYATENMVPPWWWENQKIDYFCCNSSTELLCDTFNSLGKDLMEQFLLLNVSEQTLPGENPGQVLQKLSQHCLFFTLTLQFKAKKIQIKISMLSPSQSQFLS